MHGKKKADRVLELLDMIELGGAFLERLPSELSGGQKQRISIARALIRKPNILILDDCLSAVDTETEDTILSNFKSLKDVTTLIVSHRISSIRNASKIINIEAGTKTEEGTHEALLQLNGAYAELYHKQLAEEIEKNQ
mgnify:CR=1 FL=1